MKHKRISTAFIIIVIMIISFGCDKKELKDQDLSKTAVLTVDDTSVYLNELMYHIMLAELQGQLYASFLNDEDFWNKEYSEGVTMGEVMKQEAMDNAIKYELLYLEAVKEGYSLTEEELANCGNKKDSILKSLTQKDIDRMNLSEEELLELQKKIELASRYYNDSYTSKNIKADDAYKEMKKGHKIKIDQKLWDQVEFTNN